VSNGEKRAQLHPERAFDLAVFLFSQRFLPFSQKMLFFEAVTARRFRFQTLAGFCSPKPKSKSLK